MMANAFGKGRKGLLVRREYRLTMASVAVYHALI
jgi:hypothetical protein